MSPQVKAVCDRVVAMMASQLLLEPVIDLTDAEACEARWREQRNASVVIQEFGPEAKALAQAELHQVAGGAGRHVSPQAPTASMTKRRDGVRVSGAPKGDRDAA